MPSHEAAAPGPGHPGELMHRTTNVVAERGFGLIETLVASAVLAIALLALLSVAGHGMRLDSVNRETALAADAARMQFETLRAVPLMFTFARFNADPTDDPDGPDTGEGTGFVVTGADHGLGLQGEILFPVSETGELREDLDIPEMGMPCDLNGDGTIDNLDHRDDYLILPVTVRVWWRGRSGEREMSLSGVLLP